MRAFLLLGRIILLVLTRRVGETLIIDGDIEVTILASKGNQVRVGIKAHPDIPVHRKEVQDRIDAGEPLHER